MYCFFETHVKSVADDGVTDGDLVRPRDCPDEIFEVLKVQVMPGVQTQSKFLYSHCRLKLRLYGLFPPGGIFSRIISGVKFHTVAAAGLGSFRHSGRWVYEYGRADPFFLEPCADVRQKPFVGDGVPACVGCDGVVGVRHKSDLVRDNLKDEIHETRDRIAFDVELCRHGRPDGPDV